MRPAILIDVDGVLNPDGLPRNRDFRTHHVVVDHERFWVHLNPVHGSWLLALAEETGAELMWATFWNDNANVHIGPKIGLPELLVVEIDESYHDLPWDSSLSGQEAEWKAACVANQMRGRPFVWFDDAEGLQEQVGKHAGIGEHLVVPVPYRSGLAREHIETARRWLLEQRPTIETLGGAAGANA